MITLPIVRRELLVAARRRSTYRQRIQVAGLVLIVVTAASIWMPLSRTSGATLFWLMAWGAFVFCCVEGLRAASDSIARERREGTLGLLLLTSMRPHQLVLGKLASASVQSFTAVLAMLPAFALPLLMGGVTAGEFWRVMLALVLMLFLAVSVGMVASCITSGGLAAMLLGLLALLLMMSPALVTANLVAGPLGMMLEGSAWRFPNNPVPYWIATGLTCVLISLLIGTSVFLLRRNPRLESSRRSERSWIRWFQTNPSTPSSWGGPFATEEPAIWLAEQTLPGRRALWVLVWCGAGCSFLAGALAGSSAVSLIIGLTVFSAFVVKLWMAAVAPQSISESRRSGALELLLCTPLTAERIVRGQIQALESYFLAIIPVIAIGFPVAGIFGSALSKNDDVASTSVFIMFVGVIWMLLSAMELYATANAGVWYGLTSTRIEQAIGRTVFRVAILPLLTLVVPFFGCLGLLFWPLFWSYWFSKKLKREFRDRAIIPLGEDDSGRNKD